MANLKDSARRTLIWSESYFKIDMAYAAKGGFWTTLSFFVGTAASLVTMVAFGNLLSREAYGTYNYLLSLGASLSFLTLSGVSIAVVRAVARGHESIVPAAVRLQLKYNLIAVATVLSVALYYGIKGNTLFAYSLAFLAIAYPVAEAFHIYVQVLTGRKRFDLLTKMGSIITLLSTIATVLALVLTQNILILVAVYALFSIVPNIIAYWFVTRNISDEIPDPEQLSEMRRTAFHITGAGLLGTVAQYVDKIVLFQIAGPATLAVYGFAIAGPERLKGLLKNWISTALPKLAERTLDEIRAVFYKRILLSFLVGVLMAATYIILSPLLFKWFLPRYLDAILYSQVYAISLVFLPALAYIGNIFYSQNMLRVIYISSTSIQLMRIALFVILAWLFGIWGLVAAQIATQVLTLIYSIFIWEIESRRLKNQSDS